MKKLVLVAALAVAFPVYAQQKKADDAQLKRGRYLVQIGGCNDCHTPAYPEKGGKVPESQWLTGDALGWQGPWGTTYATNLRLYFQDLTEDEWVKKGKTLKARPPMPWFNVQAMTTNDLRAMYRYIRHLGPAGKPAPAYLPPDKAPSGPVVKFPEPPKK
jgi:mono/diheme cytochrome c family protein